MKDNTVYLKHIIESIDKINKYLNGISFDEFIKDEMRVSATIREMEIIGEAANKIGEEFKNKYPDIQWRKMVDMRNFLIHQYFGVSEKIIWGTYKNDLPLLKKEIQKIIE